MKLTSKEIEAYTTIYERRRYLKYLAWNLLICGCILFANDAGPGWFPRSTVSLSTVFLIVGFFMATSMHFQASPNERLLQLLEKYVNSDAEALSQMTNKSESLASADIKQV
jgi:hypothetical protein